MTYSTSLMSLFKDCPYTMCAVYRLFFSAIESVDRALKPIEGLQRWKADCGGRHDRNDH